MGLHDFIVIKIKAARFTQNGIVNRHLAQIIHRSGSNQHIEEFIGQIIGTFLAHHRDQNFHDFTCTLDMPFHIASATFSHLRHADYPFFLHG